MSEKVRIREMKDDKSELDQCVILVSRVNQTMHITIMLLTSIVDNVYNQTSSISYKY